MNMTPSHPGEFIRRQVVEDYGLSVTDTAGILGVRRATLSDLLHGNAALLPEIALRVEKAFGLDMEIMLRMQAWHDTVRMRARADEIEVEPYEPAWSVPNDDAQRAAS